MHWAVLVLVPVIAGLPDLREDLGETLKAGAAELGAPLSGAQVESFLDYLALLEKWNRTFNLTAVRDPAEMVTRHLLDSLAVAPHLRGQRFIDVGTGAGLPGIPLALLFPDKDWHLLDSNGKKTRFLVQAGAALGLDNVSVHHCRVEAYRALAPFDAVVSRAFASLADMASGCRHLLAPGGHYLAMKGALAESELAEAAGLCRVEQVLPLEVPGLAEQRHLVIATPTAV